MTPQIPNISIDLPKYLIGKRVEVLVFSFAEADDSLNVVDRPLTHFASENVLSTDWNTAAEDLAWKDL